MELEAAIFDLGGVLTTPVAAAFRAFEESLGIPDGTMQRIFRAAYASPVASDFHLLETAQISEAEYYRRLEQRLREETGADVRLGEDPIEVRRTLWGSIRPNPEMIEIARRISRHYRTALLTNNVKEWSGWREYYPDEIFDVVVDSSQVGLRKPQAAIYQLTCERLGVQPPRAAFVDDFPDNVEGARKVGLVAFQFVDNESTIGELQRLFPRAFEPAGAS